MTRTTAAPPRRRKVASPSDFELFRLVHERATGRRVTRRQAARFLSDVAEHDGTRGGRARWLRNVAHVPPPVWHSRWKPPQTKFGVPPSVRVHDPLLEFSARGTMQWAENDACAFLKGLQAHGKQFAKVAEGVPGRGAGDVARFYYQSKGLLKLKMVVGAQGRKGRKDKEQWLTLPRKKIDEESDGEHWRKAVVR